MANRAGFDPKHLAIFSAVVRAQSMSGAAAQLGLSKSVVSRSVAQLEAELGARLLRRTTRRLSITEIGGLVLREADGVGQALERVQELAGSSRREVRGALRVSCSAAVGRAYVMPAVHDLVARHPKLEVSLQFEERLVDLVAENLDVALRCSNLVDSSLVARKLADNPRVLVASPQYLKRHGTPSRVEDLAQHACVLFRNGQRLYDEWEFAGPRGPQRVRVRGQLQLNDGLAMVLAAVSGQGVLLVDRLVLQGELERGELVELLPQHQPQMGFPLYALFVGRGLLPLKTTAFLESVQKRLARPTPRP